MASHHLAPIPITVHRGVSHYGDEYVYDKELLRLVGFATYCRLHKLAPYLWAPFDECQVEHCQPSHVEALITDCEVPPETVKRHLILALKTGVTTPITEPLIADEPISPAYTFDDVGKASILWLVWLFIIVALIIFVCVLLGVVDIFFGRTCGVFPRIISS